MTNIQRIIKYLAIAFAFYLIISIIMGILSIFNIIGNVNSKTNDKINYYNRVELNNNYSNLNINLKLTDIYIKEGEKFTLETNNKHINIKQDNDKIVIKENNNVNLNGRYKITLIVPTNKIFNNINIDTGAGVVNVEKLSSNNVNFDLGAGKTYINNLTVLNKTEIETGAGSVKINNSNLSNLDMDMGIGEVIINAFLNEDNKIDTGIGKLDIKLLDKYEKYSFKINKGIGSIELNNEELKDNTNIENGNNKLKIDGGVGNINISTTD